MGHNKNKTMKKALITGSSGLVGSEAVKFLCSYGWEVYGIDNNRRAYLFGYFASTGDTGKNLSNKFNNFHHVSIDIRNREKIDEFFRSHKFDFIIHAAAQPSHEWSINNALEDFDINAVGTINILEAYRQHSPEAVFIHVSSSKVYGDSVNSLPLVEMETRYDLPFNHKYYNGLDEDFGRLDGNLHSLFGASKACADITAKEYATYFNLPIAIFRPVCISGSAHKGCEMHGYLAYLVKCIAEGKKYTINGYKGKQVRDNIHAYDLVTAFYEVYKNPEYSYGEAYNIGGGRESNNSILEAIKQTEEILDKKAIYEYSETYRRGDHLWCIYDSSKFKKNYPEWNIKYNNDKLMKEICSQYLK